MLAPPTSSAASATNADACTIRATGLCKTIDERPILNSIDLSIAAGELVAILGANGAGKTTLLKILSSLIPPSAGTVRLFGMDLPTHARSARAHLGLIGHQTMLYRDLTARENLELFGRLYGVEGPVRRAKQLLGIVGLIDRADDPVKTFSRGMGQRLSIARALVHEPELLLADEPFSGLDLAGASAVEQLLLDLHSAGKTIVMVNHDVQQSLRLASRIIVLAGGAIAIDRPALIAEAPLFIRHLSGTDTRFACA